MTLEEMSAAAHKMGIPVIVDAAAERLTIPNVYLTKGADMVAYSGGKCLRGPQCAGLLLGRKDLLQAAWLNSAPHHAFGRSLKVGKEEIMGMLAAVEAWVKRDHDKEWKEWETWLATIREKVTSVPGVRAEVVQPRGPSNYAPQLRVSWDAAKIPLTGNEALEALLAGEPRVIVSAGEEPSLTVMPYMMMPGDDRIAARRIHEVLANPPKIERPAPGESAQLAGQWEVEIEFVRGTTQHKLFLEQKGETLTGNHRGETTEGDVRGKVMGSRARFRSGHRYEGTNIGYTFDGTLNGNALAGTVDLGEYGKAKFTARRRWA
jgi:L-seryl-tRNA(Ser) seleniumtransferase